MTITVPGPGTVVVSANAEFQIQHASGTTDLVFLYLGTSTSSCVADAFSERHSIPGNLPTDTYNFGMFVQKPFAIAAAGTYTVYLNPSMVVASANDWITDAAMIAVFYPS